MIVCPISGLIAYSGDCERPFRLINNFRVHDPSEYAPSEVARRGRGDCSGAKTNRELGVKNGDFVCYGFTGSQSPVLVDLACPDSCFAWGYDAFGNRKNVYEPRFIKDVVEHIIQGGMTALARQIVKTNCWPEIAREIKRKINPYFWQSDASNGAKVFEGAGINQDDRYPNP